MVPETLKQREKKQPLARWKKRMFFFLMAMTPVVFFFLLEGVLRLLQYGGDLRLFIEGPPGYEIYYRCNPNIARRYFTVQSVVPTPPHQLFLKKKSSNGYRIFVLGESSAAGFPYSANASFPNVLGRMLAETFPEKHIEVVNLSLSAVNSYALLDFMDEILQQSPDLILIYAGHNEYYGALGVGSSQSVGRLRSIVHLYLSLNKFRTFLFLRDCLGWFKLKVSSLLYHGSVVDPSATLMATIVAEQVIPYKSTLYELGKKQFQDNLSRILEKAHARAVPVLLGELVSNERDQPPFISLTVEGEESAAHVFAQARECEREGKYTEAKTLYKRAKDLDALRFRAPEEFNTIIRAEAGRYGYPVVPLVHAFETHSPSDIIGDALMHEHLHPTKEGYFLMAQAYYETMRTHQFISETWRAIAFDDVWRSGVTEFDSVYAALVIRHLKGSWPFQPKGIPNRFTESFVANDSVEALAFRVLLSDNFNVEAAHLELARRYEQQGNFAKAFAEYRALLASLPQEIEFYNKAALCLLREHKYDSARIQLQHSLRYAPNSFAYKWIGQIALLKNDAETAITYLSKANLWDPQVVFNLSRAYYTTGRWNEGETYYARLRSIAPRSDYVAYLQKMRIVSKVKSLSHQSSHNGENNHGISNTP